MAQLSWGIISEALHGVTECGINMSVRAADANLKVASIEELHLEKVSVSRVERLLWIDSFEAVNGWFWSYDSGIVFVIPNSKLIRFGSAVPEHCNFLKAFKIATLENGFAWAAEKACQIYHFVSGLWNQLIEIADGRLKNVCTHLFGNHVGLGRNLTRWLECRFPHHVNRFEIFIAV